MKNAIASLVVRENMSKLHNANILSGPGVAAGQHQAGTEACPTLHDLVSLW